VQSSSLKRLVHASFGLAIVAATLLSAGIMRTAEAAAPLSEDVNAIAVAPDRSATAIVTGTPPAVCIVRGSSCKRVSLKREATQVQISWSSDSRYLAIEYEISDDASFVDILDVLRTPLTIVPVTAGHSAKWRPGRQQLVIAPNYGAADLPQVEGLIVFDPVHQKVTTVGKGFYFTGTFDFERSGVLAQSMRYVKGRVVSSLVRVPLDEPGAASTVFRPGCEDH